MTEPKRPLKVFLCHAPIDSDAVYDLYTRLTNDGLDAWLDEEKLLPGQDREYEIRKAVREADVVVVCLSKQFNRAGIQQKEVRLALDTAMEQPEGEIFIIPARLEKCETPLSLQRWQSVDLFKEDGYERLMRALRADKTNVPVQVKRENPDPARKPDQPKPAGTEENDREAVKPKIEKLEPGKTKTRGRLNTAIVVALIGVLGTIITGLLSSPIIEKLLFPTQSVDATPTLQTVKPIETDTAPVDKPSPVATDFSTLTPSETQIVITSTKSPEMVLVEGGEFIMGPAGNMRTINVDSFYVDRYEVTNSFYGDCVKGGVCEGPTDAELASVNYFGNSDYDSYPVIWVSRQMAEQYCAWRGARLPSSAEWEKAARGTDHRMYPWGNQSNIASRANGKGNEDGFDLTAPVGSFSLGVSPYGAYDMAGNVSEWVSDDHQTDSGVFPMHKGGNWVYSNLRSGDFSWEEVASRSWVGFRCAKDAP